MLRQMFALHPKKAELMTRKPGLARSPSCMASSLTSADPGSSGKTFMSRESVRTLAATLPPSGSAPGDRTSCVRDLAPDPAGLLPSPSCNNGSYARTTCSKASNAGRPTQEAVTLSYDSAAATRACAFLCPGKERRRCMSLQVDESELLTNPLARENLLNAVMNLRLYFARPSTSQSKAQLIANKMLELTANKHSRLQMHAIPWVVGNRSVCTHCYCAAAGLLSETSDGSIVYKRTFELARAAYYRQLNPEIRDRVKELSGDKLGLHGNVVVVPSCKPDASGGPKPRASKLEHAEVWLSSWRQPEAGNVQHRTDDEFDHVQGLSQRDIWREYNEQHPDGAGPTTFHRAFKKCQEDGLARFSFNRWHCQGECSECVALKICLGRAKTEVERKQYQEQLDLHHFITRGERLAYGTTIKVAETKPFGKYIWSIGMDGYSTFKSSGPSIHGKPLSQMKGCSGVTMTNAEQLKFKTTGALVHGYGYFLYVLHPTIPANANSNIHCLQRTLEQMFEALEDPTNTEVMHWPTMLAVQVDGATDNKNRAFFAYCEHLVLNGTFETVWVSFLIVGHTHADYDQMFVPITKKLRLSKVKQVADLLEVYHDAYSTKPKNIEVVEAVPNFWEWLVKEGKVEVAGMAERVPDVQRPHRFVFDRTPEGLAGTHGCNCTYYNLASNQVDDAMNAVLIDGQKVVQPVHWLQRMPDCEGPKMQRANAKHVDSLNSSKPNVYANFNLNERCESFDPCASCVVCRYDDFFTAADMDWYDDLYDTCASCESLDNHMASKYAYKKLPVRDLAPDEVKTLKHELWTQVPPLTHQNYTAADKKRMIQEEQKAREEADKLLDEQVADYLKGKDHHRGVRALSKASKERVAFHERKVIAASLGMSRPPVERAKDNGIKILGASWGGVDEAGDAFETTYLVQWEGYKDHPDEFQWVSACEVKSLSGLSEQVLHQRMVVFWVAKVSGEAPQTVWHGTCTDLDADDESSLQRASWDLDLCCKVQYDQPDCTAELLNLQTLETLSSECQTCGIHVPTSHHRIAWMLESVMHDLPKVMELHRDMTGDWSYQCST